MIRIPFVVAIGSKPVPAVNVIGRPPARYYVPVLEDDVYALVRPGVRRGSLPPHREFRLQRIIGAERAVHYRYIEVTPRA